MEVVVPRLLQTKLQRPRYTRNLITRPRLLDRLNEGAVAPLTLVCAPAGYGKTTLVSSWFAGLAAEKNPGGPIPTAWISLDERDSDARVFLQYLIAGLRTLFAGACGDTLQLLHARQAPSGAQLMAALSNEIAQLPHDFVLALDDYQSITGTGVADLLSSLLQHWPHPMHLVLISREVPGLPLAALRASGQITEIRTRDLRFTSEETAAYVNQALPAALSQSAVEVLEARTEGWVAGLQLAALSLRSADDSATLLAGLSGAQPDFADYLVEEVLSRLPSAIVGFLYQTANLEYFSSALCEAVIEADDPGWDARTCIDWLEQRNLFIVPRDTQKTWYRYHHLFRGLLQQRAKTEIGPSRIDEINRKAAGWFAERGLVEEALRYALAADDLELAATIIEQGLREVLNGEDQSTLQRWLRLLPLELVERRPALLLAQAWSLHLSWQLDAGARVLRRAAVLLNEGADASLSDDELRALRGQIADLQGLDAYFNNQYGQTIACCREALVLLPASWTYCRGVAMIYLGLAMAADGQADGAEKLLIREYEALHDKSSTFAMRILVGLCLVYYTQAEDLERLRQTAQRIAEVTESFRWGALRSWGQYLLGLAHYQRNELAEAEKHFASLLHNENSAQIAALRDGAMRLALIKQIRGQQAGAWQVVEVLSRLDLENMGRESAETAALRARLTLMSGDLEDATRWADAFSQPVSEWPPSLDDSPYLVQAQILLTRGSAADVQAALATLDALVELTERSHNRRLNIEVVALRALALGMQGRGDEAENALELAVDAARPGGFIRPFVNFGPSMQRALEQLGRHAETRRARPHVGAETVRRILAEFPNHGPATPPGGTRVAPALPPSGPVKDNGRATGVESLVEPLTIREVEILALMREPLSLKEIAPLLHISYQTARRHTANILGKLGVHKRWAAVARAEALGLLPPR